MKEENHIPKDLIITMYNRFNWIVYESRLTKKVFVSYYYESGFNQDSLVFYLTEKELQNFRSEPLKHLKKQSSDISKYYKELKNTRAIKDFHKRVDIKSLLPDWKKINNADKVNISNYNSDDSYKIKTKQNTTLIDTNINKSFRLKIHGTSGPGFHSEFKFSIQGESPSSEFGKIQLKVNWHIRSTTNITVALEHFHELVKKPMHRGIKRFVDYLTSNNMAISQNLSIHILEYVFHPIDSKPIGNEIGMEIALKSVFKDQIGFEVSKQYIHEE